MQGQHHGTTHPPMITCHSLTPGRNSSPNWMFPLRIVIFHSSVTNYQGVPAKFQPLQGVWWSLWKFWVSKSAVKKTSFVSDSFGFFSPFCNFRDRRTKSSLKNNNFVPGKFRMWSLEEEQTLEFVHGKICLPQVERL